MEWKWAAFPGQVDFKWSYKLCMFVIGKDIVAHPHCYEVPHPPREVRSCKFWASVGLAAAKRLPFLPPRPGENNILAETGLTAAQTRTHGPDNITIQLSHHQH